MRGVAGHFKNRGLSGAWNTWLAMCDAAATMDHFANRMLQRELLKGWNKWYAQVEEYWRLQKIMRRMKNVGVARCFDHWLSTREDKSVFAKRTRGYMTIQHLKKLARAWRLWRTNAIAIASRKRMNDTFKFSKQPEAEDLHAEAVDWRASLQRGRTRGAA